MGIQAPAEVKYSLIHEAIRQDDNTLNISVLCRIAGVSRSGYYAWLDAAADRQRREEADSQDFALVKEAYEFRGYKLPKNKHELASILIKRALQDGPVESSEIRKLMSEYRIGEKTMNDVKTLIGIKPYRKMRSWYWSLPGEVKETSDE